MKLPKEMDNSEYLNQQVTKLMIAYKLGINIMQTHEKQLKQLVEAITLFVYKKLQTKQKIYGRKNNDSVKMLYDYIKNICDTNFNTNKLFDISVVYIDEGLFETPTLEVTITFIPVLMFGTVYLTKTFKIKYKLFFKI